MCRHVFAHTLTWSQAHVHMNTCIYTDTDSGTYVPMHTHTTYRTCTRVRTRAHRHIANAHGGTRPGTCSQIHVSTLKDTWAHIVTCTHAHNHRSLQHNHTPGHRLRVLTCSHGHTDQSTHTHTLPLPHTARAQAIPTPQSASKPYCPTTTQGHTGNCEGEHSQNERTVPRTHTGCRNAPPGRGFHIPTHVGCEFTLTRTHSHSQVQPIIETHADSESQTRRHAKKRM